MPIPTEADWALLMEMAREYRNRRGNTQQRPVVPFPVGQAPEVYFVRTPEAGINPELGTGTPALTGYADCEVLFRLFDGTFIDAGFTITVYNLGTEAVGPYELGLAVREKGGTWVFVPTTPGAGGTTPSGGGTSLSGVQVYTSSDTWTKPSGVSFVIVECVGGGGGGGGADGATTLGTNNSVGGGGQAGGYSWRKIVAADLAGSVTVTVGSGGGGGSGTSSGTDGGDTTFDNTAAKVVAQGGYGGAGGSLQTSAPASTNGGFGISGTALGTVAVPGQAGDTGYILSLGGLSGSVIPGRGGSGPLGVGGCVAVTPASGIQPAYGYGGGGCGATGSTFGTASGSAGTGGLVRVYEYTTN